MTYRQPDYNAAEQKSNSETQPILGWLAIIGLVLFSTVCIIGGLGSIFRPAYVVLTFAVGIFLYLRYPLLYMGFNWWLWFVTPLISRLIDYRSSFDDSRFILISTYLVTLITLHTTIKELPKSYKQGGLPYILAFIPIFYSFLVGLVKTQPFTAFRGLLDWLTPVSFGFYLFLKWRDYPQYRKNFQSVFLWGVLVVGIYGVVQYIIAPDWDRYWLISTKLTSMGQPEPFKIRVWSTMASPGPFSVMMTAGLILLFSGKSPLIMPAAGGGYLAFLLCQVRTMWGCYVVSLLTLLTSLKPKLQMRLFITILVMAICVVPLTTIEPFSGVIGTRLQSFTNLEDDDSAKVRQKIYEEGVNQALTNSLGNGIGNTFIVDEEGILRPIIIDSGILDTFFTLGWFGAIPYLIAIILLLITVLQASEFIKFDPFMAASRSIAVGCVCGIPGFSIMLGYSGMLLWGFLSISLAAHKYYQNELLKQYQE